MSSVGMTRTVIARPMIRPLGYADIVLTPDSICPALVRRVSNNAFGIDRHRDKNKSCKRCRVLNWSTRKLMIKADASTSTAVQQDEAVGIGLVRTLAFDRKDITIEPRQAARAKDSCWHFTAPASRTGFRKTIAVEYLLKPAPARCP
jgi:hypothetical protein